MAARGRVIPIFPAQSGVNAREPDVRTGPTDGSKNTSSSLLPKHAADMNTGLKQWDRSLSAPMIMNIFYLDVENRSFASALPGSGQGVPFKIH